jgi:hypothetical protein
LPPACVRYAVVCDEGARAKGYLDIVIPSNEEYAEQLAVKESGLSSSQLEELAGRAWAIICE